MRIAKFIASCGICSRRDAEKKILQREVSVDGVVISSPALNLRGDEDVKIQGKSIFLLKPRLWIYHKPRGLVTSHRDEKSRDTVFSSLKDKLPRVISVGRLDLNSEGLLLLTNNGEVARSFELPQNKFNRVYEVQAIGDPKFLLSAGLEFLIDDITYKFESIDRISEKDTYTYLNSIKAKEVRVNRDKVDSMCLDLSNTKVKYIRPKEKDANYHSDDLADNGTWYRVVLQEGKNREIRRVFAEFNLLIKRLIRVEYAGYNLGNLKSGEYTEMEYKND